MGLLTRLSSRYFFQTFWQNPTLPGLPLHHHPTIWNLLEPPAAWVDIMFHQVFLSWISTYTPTYLQELLLSGFALSIHHIIVVGSIGYSCCLQILHWFLAQSSVCWRERGKPLQMVLTLTVYIQVGYIREVGRSLKILEGEQQLQTADAAMASYLLGVLAWLRVSILEWIHQHPCSWSGGEAPQYLVSSWGWSTEESCGG